MADLCCKFGCGSLGTKSCGACGAARYCSVECQKEDWKVHKHSCVNAKKLPTSFLSMPEIGKHVKKIDAQLNLLLSQGKYKEAITLQQQCQAFVEHQFGVPVVGSSKWRRSNGNLVDNMHLINIRMALASMCRHAADTETSLAYAIEARQMLELRDKSDDMILFCLAKAENVIAMAHPTQLDVAEHHCEQSLMFARLIKGKDRIESEYPALQIYSNIRDSQCRYLEAIEFAEQSYVLVSEAYGPVHPHVQEAAAQLIYCLIKNDDYSRADRYCRMNYENLTDPRNGLDCNRNNPQVAEVMMQIANIWLQKPPVDDEKAAFALAEEAEDMIRKSCSFAAARHIDITSERYRVFGDVLVKRGKYTDETRRVLEQSLALRRQDKSAVSYIPNMSQSLYCLVNFHHHISETMPPGNARDREFCLRDKYMMEFAEFAELDDSED